MRPVLYDEALRLDESIVQGTKLAMQHAPRDNDAVAGNCAIRHELNFENTNFSFKMHTRKNVQL